MNTATYSQLSQQQQNIITSNPCGHMNWDVAGEYSGVSGSIAGGCTNP
jgi:hypothetical protein